MTKRDVATVYLVDDDESIRRAMSRLIRLVGYQVRAFATAREFLDDDDALSVPGAFPACLVLDIQLTDSDLDGMALQRELCERRVALPIIFITGHGDIPTTVQAMKGGAVDFLPKPVQEADLLGAIKQAIDCSRRDAESAASCRAIRQRFDLLTPREVEVMEFVVSGYLNKQIAAELGIVEKTIKVHRGRVMEKMRAGSLADLVRMAQDLDMTPLTPHSGH